MPQNVSPSTSPPADAAPAGKRNASLGIRASSLLLSHGPGLLLTTVLAVAATLLAHIDVIGETLHLGPVVLAVVLGAAARNAATLPKRCQPGVRVSLKTVLGVAIVLLGFELSLAEVVGIGGAGLAAVAAVVAGTLGGGYAIGRALGVRRRLSWLLAAGCAICGTSAIVAVNAALGTGPGVDGAAKTNQGEDAAYAVAIVSMLGTIALFFYPLAQAVLSLPPSAYGVWAGASIHSVGQAIAAGFAVGPEAGQATSLVKLTRVVFIAPVTLGLSLWGTGGTAGVNRATGSWRSQASVPWFLVGFLVVVAVHSAGVVPENIVDALVEGEGFLLTVAMAAMGLEIRFGDVRRRGLAPLWTGLLATVVASTLALGFALFSL